MPIARIEATLKKAGLDRYMMLLVLTVVTAGLFPASGGFAAALNHITYWAVALLFFIYGAKLSTSTIVAGFVNWRLQLGVLVFTFALFPILGLALQPLFTLFLPSAIAVGFLYFCCMPSTVQSSIAFTSVSKGNVAGAVCAASVSNLIGVVISPFLFSLLLPQGSTIAVDPAAIWKIGQQILLPFAIGQLCRPLLQDLLTRRKTITMVVDRGSILLIVYAAFSAGVVNGIWEVVKWGDLAILIAFCGLLLALVMGIAIVWAKIMSMPRPDLITLIYCGSTKSLATGLPMAGIVFSGQDISLIVLPLMIFHLLQLMVCAVLSQRIAAKVA